MIELCSLCNSRFESNFPEGPCHICGNLLDSLPVLTEKALSELQKHPEWNSFALSTSIPKKLLSKEEEAWDFSNGESIKSWFNAILSRALIKETNKQYRPIGADGRITISFVKQEVSSANEPLFVFGRYRKLIHGICQSKWVCLKCNGVGCKHCNGKGKMYDESVEELMGDPFVSRSGGKYTLHASGREDIDVFNFAGRPFVLEITHPKNIAVNLEEFVTEVNNGQKIELSDVKFAPPSSVTLVSDSHFPKTYRAWIGSKEPLSNADAEKLLSFDYVLLQKTPTRVVHRRADKIRKRRAQVLSSTLKDGMIIIDVRADAGTYIKELIHSDGGRTQPSISSVLGKECTCERLDVIGIEDDFLKLVLG